MVCLMQVILFAFASYFIADGQKQSGIVSVLFCGMVRVMCRAWPISCLVVFCMLLEKFGTTSAPACLLQTMANYTRRNLTPYAQQSSMAFFKSWATMVRLANRLPSCHSRADTYNIATPPTCANRSSAGRDICLHM